MPCETECASWEDQINFLQNKSIIFAYTNMAVDPSQFTTNPIKQWIDTTLIIPLSALRHQMHTISVTPVIFSKDEQIVQTGIH